MALIDTYNHAVIWLDHVEAHVIHFNPEEAESALLKTRSTHRHQHHKAGSIGSGRAPADQHFLHDIVAAVEDAEEILIVGPGSAKTALVKHLHRHDPAIAARVVGIETVDHPSDGQLLAYARQYFVRADRLRGDPLLN